MSNRLSAPTYLPISLVVLIALAWQPLARFAAEISVSQTGHLPLSFVPNTGQTDEAVQFQVRSLDGTLFFTPHEVVLSLPSASPEPTAQVVGLTLSTDFPTVNAVQISHSGGDNDIFVAKLNAAGSALMYSTYLGDSLYGDHVAVAVDSDSSAYIAGSTDSSGFPLSNPYQNSLRGTSDAIVAKITSQLEVNSTDDTNDGTCNTAHCSLREAINAANATPGMDTIAFDIPGAGPHTIQPASALPLIADPVIIDGTTEPNYAGTPIVVIDGSLITGGFTNGLMISGGDTTVRGLVINHFTFAGIFLGSGGNVIEGNYIGTDVTGTTAAGNRDGIYIFESGNNRVGGTTAAARNIISGNNDDGMNFEGALAISNIVQGNYIGTTANGVNPLGNAGDGVKISDSSGDNAIGGANPGEGNLIAFNNHNGVMGEGTTSGGTGNAILGNSIHSNNRLGIDLRDEGITANDANDADTGPNNVQNFPVLDSVAISASSVAVGGSLDSTASTTYRLEFFANPACDSSGYGEGRVYIGSTTVSSDGSGHAAFSVTLPVSIPTSSVITSTAMDSDNNTSEFSQCKGIPTPTPTPTSQPEDANLAVSQMDFPDPVVANLGPNEASGVTFTDTLPSSATFVSAVPSQGNCLQNTGVVSCNLGIVNNNQSATVTIIVISTASGLISNFAGALAIEFDPDGSNNGSTITTNINLVLLPSATFTPTDTPSPYTPPATMTATLIPSPPPIELQPSLTPSDTLTPPPPPM